MKAAMLGLVIACGLAISGGSILLYWVVPIVKKVSDALVGQ